MHLAALFAIMIAATSCEFLQCKSSSYHRGGRHVLTGLGCRQPVASRRALANTRRVHGATASRGYARSPALYLNTNDNNDPGREGGDSDGKASTFTPPESAKKGIFANMLATSDESKPLPNMSNADSNNKNDSKSNKLNGLVTYGSIAFTVLFTVVIISNIGHQADVVGTSAIPASTVLSQGVVSENANIFDPANFQPVCPTSDNVYQLLKVTANSLVGSANVIEYGPLIASVLLRVRLELCVLESFLYEAVVPFVQTKGLSWVLPLHETVETFLAGTIFALASNFILLGSTKIISVLFIYADALTGFPARLLGSGIKKASSSNKPLDLVGSGIKVYGDILGTSRKLIENVDTFVGRYLVIATTAYIGFKFLHYKVFNDVF